MPGLVIAGDRSSVDDADRLAALVDVGIDTFVCLQAKSELEVLINYEPNVKRLLHARQGAAASAASCGGGWFRRQPIPDQSVADDGVIDALVDDLLAHLADGRKMYIHCRGGHGRTGTICALLLARAYGLSASEALTRYQWYHDTRKQPVFAADGYAHLGGGDGAASSCVALFPIQRQQVERLVKRRGSGAARSSAGPPEGEGEPLPPQEQGARQSLASATCEVAAPPPGVSRGLSSRYGAGASKYDEATLRGWESVGRQAAAAVRSRDWAEAEAHTLATVAARPDWYKGYTCLSMIRNRRGDPEGAMAALCAGLDACSSDHARDELRDAAAKLEAARSDAAASAPDAVPESSSSAAAHSTAPSAAPATAPTSPPPASAASTPPPATSAAAKRRWPRMVVLVGLPGAGKSTFAQALAASDPAWVCVSQDEVGSRAGVEAMLGRLGRDDGARIVLDRCNVDAVDRRQLVELAMLPAAARVVCVFFTGASARECEDRVASRTAHPTIPYGGGRSAVQSMAKLLVPPTTAREAWLDEVIEVRSFEEANALLARWGAAAPEVVEKGLYKFPRTHHVLNTGGTAVTRDDLIMATGDLRRFVGSGAVVIAEEKVDGANLGLSLSADYEVRAQNRSHWVCSGSHAQFKGLDGWLDEHSWALCQLLVPEVEVLFGEWCYARHSVPYTRLPNYFIAFDIYNKRSGRFVSVAERNRRLEGLGIPVVPLLARQPFSTTDELLALLESRSAYYDGFVEGAYLRVDDPEDADGGGGQHNLHRGKIVRPDFIQGIKEHWQSRQLQKNGLAR